LMRVRTRGRKRPERTRQSVFPAQRPSYWPFVPLDFSRPVRRPSPAQDGWSRGRGIRRKNHKCGDLTATGLRLMRYEYTEQAPLHRTTAESHTSGSAAAAGEGVL
jgi:hypothetical protein